MKRLIILLSIVFAIVSCDNSKQDEILTLAWAGIPVEHADTLLAMAKECGFDLHLAIVKDRKSAIKMLDAAEKAGIGLLPLVTDLKDSTAQVVKEIGNHPALFAYDLKDEPETSDIEWLASLTARLANLDPGHPAYINLYPNWAWDTERYAERIEEFASKVEVPFYSFDQYPVTEVEGKIVLRPTWYRNLEEFSAMASRHGKPFWAFALSSSHFLGPPSPPAFYPVPTLGHLRLQVFSDLVYGAQVIQYFTFRGMYDKTTLEKTPVFDLVRRVNSEIKGYSPVFAGCKVIGVWHLGENIPEGTQSFATRYIPALERLEWEGEGAVVSLIENGGKRFMAVVNRDCVNEAAMEYAFSKPVRVVTPFGRSARKKADRTKLEPGNMTVFEL